MLEVILALNIILVLYCVTCMAEDALAPPLLMGDKEFSRRAEVRQDVETLELHANVFLDHINHLKLNEFVIQDSWRLAGLYNRAKEIIQDIDMIDAALIDEETYQSLKKIKLRILARADMIEARYMDLNDLNRSEARKNA